MRDIISGLVLIGIGLALGGSIFRGDFSPTSLFFDGLGLFWVGKGVYGMMQSKS
jgi:hypothetical protein